MNKELELKINNNSICRERSIVRLENWLDEIKLTLVEIEEYLKDNKTGRFSSKEAKLQHYKIGLFVPKIENRIKEIKAKKKLSSVQRTNAMLKAKTKISREQVLINALVQTLSGQKKERNRAINAERVALESQLRKKDFIIEQEKARSEGIEAAIFSRSSAVIATAEHTEHTEQAKHTEQIEQLIPSMLRSSALEVLDEQKQKDEQEVYVRPIIEIGE